MYKRSIELNSYIKNKSLFLLGPRQTGKSTLVKHSMPQARYIDLLESETFRALSRAPEQLRQMVGPNEQVVIVDEVQKLPSLLNEVQLMLDRNKNLKFCLTGSSARKLRRGNANLLGGRALFFSLHPLVSAELDFNRIPDQLVRGSLPAIIDSDIYLDELRAYVGSYLREEIQAEGLSRSIENFSRFLDFAAHLNTSQMNYTKIGNDAQIPPRTVKDYVKILEDTSVAHCLPPLRSPKGRKTVAVEKFYLFDVGVANALLGRKEVLPKTPDYGEALEHFVFLELKAYLNYKRIDCDFSYWRTRTQLEVDFVLDKRIAIEVKGASRVSPTDLKGLRALAEEHPIEHSYIVCDEPNIRMLDANTTVTPIRDFCQKLWSGDILA
jgi:predicted AAA+ superfamily ATPase